MTGSFKLRTYWIKRLAPNLWLHADERLRGACGAPRVIITLYGLGRLHGYAWSGVVEQGRRTQRNRA